MSTSENTCTCCGLEWKDIKTPCPKSGTGVHHFYGDYLGFSQIIPPFRSFRNEAVGDQKK